MAARRYYTEEEEDRYRIPLEGDDVTYAAVIRGTTLEPKPFNRKALSTFLHDAAGRGTPIEPRFLGNTEIHVISRPVPGISDRGFVAHYTRFDHSLEVRAEFDVPADFFLDQGSFIVGLSTSTFNPPPDSISIPDTPATPTESRGEEVAISVEDDDAAPAAPGLDLSVLESNLEVGQAVASVAFAAAAMGWDARLLGPTLGFTALGRLMGLTKETDLANELPVAAILIFPSPASILQRDIAVSAIKSSIMATFTDRLRWNGRPYGVNTPEHSDNVRRAIAMAEDTAGDEHVCLDRLRYCTTGRDFRYDGRVTLRQALRSRESVSVADFDGDYTMPQANLRQFLLRCCHGDCTWVDTRLRRGIFPCGVLPWLSRVNVYVFVNRVEGFETGLYCLVRNATGDLGSFHLWEEQRLNAVDDPVAFPFAELEELYLFRREVDPERRRHKQSAVLVVMVAPFTDVVMEADYMYMYSRQIWEAGFLGEVLAVEAQAQGLSVSALDTQDYDWKSGLRIRTKDSGVISVYALGKRKQGGKKLGLFKEAVSGCFSGGAKHVVP